MLNDKNLLLISYSFTIALFDIKKLVFFRIW